MLGLLNHFCLSWVLLVSLFSAGIDASSFVVHHNKHGLLVLSQLASYLASAQPFSSTTSHVFQSEQTLKKASENELKSSSNPWFYQLTALLYHVEHTKKCGDNLQKFNIDLEPLWNHKFSAQTKKAVKLANLINHMIANHNKDSTNKATAMISNTRLIELLNDKLIKSSLMESLSYFMFSNAQDSSSVSSFQSTANPRSANSFEIADDLVDKKSYLHSAKYSKSSGGEASNDHFLFGYGVLLLNEIGSADSYVESTAGSSGSAAAGSSGGREGSDKKLRTFEKCSFIFNKYSNDSKSFGRDDVNADYLVKNKSCSTLNLFIKDPNQRESDFHISGSPNGNDDIKVPDSRNVDDDAEGGGKHNLSREYLKSLFYSPSGNGHEDRSANCVNWFERLEKNYNTYIKRLRDEFRSNRRKAVNITSENYKIFLQRLLENKNSGMGSWCGPFYECANSKNNNGDWILLYALPLFNVEKDLLGAVVIKLNLNQMDINQCPEGDPVFADTHKCKQNTDCVYFPSRSFRAGNYKCRCPYGQVSSTDGVSYNSNNMFDGTSIETQYWRLKSNLNNSFEKSFNCLPCKGLRNCCFIDQDASFIEAPGSALIDSSLNEGLAIARDYNQHFFFILSQCRNYNTTLRYVILIVQCIFILITLSLSMVIFYSRQNKIIKHSMWVLLEIILFGALLLYSTLLFQYFEPTSNICIAIPWFRELGFTIVYGILNLRLYKILIEFQSRKAHVVQLKDKDILRILSFIVVCVFGYLTAWTLVDLDYAGEGFSLLTNTSLKGYIQYPICKIKWWDYFIEIAEFLFICVGFYLLYCTRTAPSEFNERKFISLVIYFEGIVSTLLHIIKHSIYSSMHPDTMLILYFIRCHTTVTVMLLFIFITKLCFLLKPNSEEYCRTSRLSTIDGNDLTNNTDSGKCQPSHLVGNAEFELAGGELNLVEMEPEEIRSELKRLYTQLHIFKTKSVKADNPHIQSKRKTNRKGRRFSNAFASKSMAKDNESLQIKTPDESICSTDAHVAFLNVGTSQQVQHQTSHEDNAATAAINKDYKRTESNDDDLTKNFVQSSLHDNEPKISLADGPSQTHNRVQFK